MYRLILLLGLIYVSEGTWWRGHRHHHNHSFHHHHNDGYHMHWHHHRWHSHNWHSAHDQHFEKLSTSVIQTDQYSQATCKQYSNMDVRQEDGPNDYKLIYAMKQCDTESLVVQIKYRVIYVYARKTGEEESNYYDVRILPTLLKTKLATWVYKDEELTVVIPNDVESLFKLNSKDCVEVNDEVINVPKGPVFQYRYGDQSEDLTE